jgi:hypothetical protein
LKAGAASRTRSSGRAAGARGTGRRPAYHRPGVQPADVAELLEHRPEVVVLSQGILQALQVCPETWSSSSRGGIPANVLQTEDAVRLHDELAETQRAAGLFHSTC